jgi:Flp pilus assembly protein TadD
MKDGDLKRFIESRRASLVCLLLAAMTFVIYWQVSGFEFTNYDEFIMILKNPYVLSGLTLQGFTWALTTSWFDYWHPLPWISHMLDCELFGLNPGWHHLVNLAFHVADSLLLFVVLRRMTAAFWRSAIVAALFALHPLHVESVAWVAERKDTLSALFFLLTLWAYTRHVEHTRGRGVTSRNKERGPESEEPKVNRGPLSSAKLFNSPGFWYWVTLGMFALGLMSKPMVLTLPFVLFLLDYWPLARFQLTTESLKSKAIIPLVAEKTPFFVLTAFSCAISYWGVKAGGSIVSAQQVSWGLRLANVPVSYARYLGKMIWPTDLVALYPMPSHWAGWQVGGAVAVLALISLFVAYRARSAPYLIVGWLFFLGILVPIIGIVQAGFQSIADRYTYIPSIGIFIAVVWAAAEWGSARSRPAGELPGSTFDVYSPSPAQAQATAALPAPEHGRDAFHRVPFSSGEVTDAVEHVPTKPSRVTLLTGAAVVVLLLCGYVTWVQTGYWRNSFTLWSHCLAVCPDNVVARYNLGYVLQHSGKTSEAIEQYQAALRLKPDHPDANLNLGIALIGSRRAQEATNYLAAAVRIKPDYARARGALGLALYELGDYTGAVTHCAEAIRLDPDTFGPYVDMGRALSAQGKSDEALRYYAEGLRLSPGLALTHYYLGLEWMKRSAFEQAEASFGEAVRLAPGWAEARAQQQHALNEAKKLQTDPDDHRSPKAE